MKYFLRGIIAAILFAVLMFGGLMTGFMVLCYLAVPPMLYMYYCLFKVIIAIVKKITKKGKKATDDLKLSAEVAVNRKRNEYVETQQQEKIDKEAAPYRALADSGDLTAIKEIAKVYYKNKKRDEAKKLYVRAAEGGDVDAQLILAKNYEFINTTEAEEWATKVQNNPSANESEKQEALNIKRAMRKREQKREYVEEYERARREALDNLIQEERRLAVTGDYFLPRPDGRCRNEGQTCRYCARRKWDNDRWICRM